MHELLKRTLCCAYVIGIFYCGLPMQAGAAGQLVANTAEVSAKVASHIIPSKFAAITGLCVVGGLTAQALWTRYVTLKNIDELINPEALLYVDQRAHPIYNWIMGVPEFSSPAQIRIHSQEVKAALVTACLSGQVDVFQIGTGSHLTAGRVMHWSDVMSTINVEMARIRRIMRDLERFVDISFKGIHLFGIRKNFVAECDNLGITGLQLLHHNITVDQEEQLDAAMSQDRGLFEKIIAWCMANPNYDKAYRIFWELDKRLGMLQAIKEAIVHTPVNWNIALH